MVGKNFDIVRKTYPIWSYLSYSDVKNRFRRSKLGLLWPIFHQLAFSLGAGLIWAAVFNLEPENFIPFLTLGFAIWGFISACMVEGCSTFIIAHGYLKQLPLPQVLFIYRTLYTQLIYLVIGLMTALAILFYYEKLQIMGIIYAIPGLIILMLYAYGAIGALAYLGLRYRDLPHGLSSLFSLLFVVTPVIYPAEVLLKKGFSIVVYGNPFSSLIEIVRYPLLQADFANIEHYCSAVVFALLLILVRSNLGSRWSRYVPFWS